MITTNAVLRKVSSHTDQMNMISNNNNNNNNNNNIVGSNPSSSTNTPSDISFLTATGRPTFMNNLMPRKSLPPFSHPVVSINSNNSSSSSSSSISGGSNNTNHSNNNSTNIHHNNGVSDDGEDRVDMLMEHQMKQSELIEQQQLVIERQHKQMVHDQKQHRIIQNQLLEKQFQDHQHIQQYHQQQQQHQQLQQQQQQQQQQQSPQQSQLGKSKDRDMDLEPSPVPAKRKKNRHYTNLSGRDKEPADGTLTRCIISVNEKEFDTYDIDRDLMENDREGQLVSDDDNLMFYRKVLAVLTGLKSKSIMSKAQRDRFDKSLYILLDIDYEPLLDEKGSFLRHSKQTSINDETLPQQPIGEFARFRLGYWNYDFYRLPLFRETIIQIIQAAHRFQLPSSKTTQPHNTLFEMSKIIEKSGWHWSFSKASIAQIDCDCINSPSSGYSKPKTTPSSPLPAPASSPSTSSAAPKEPSSVRVPNSPWSNLVIKGPSLMETISQHMDQLHPQPQSQQQQQHQQQQQPIIITQDSQQQQPKLIYDSKQQQLQQQKLQQQQHQQQDHQSPEESPITLYHKSPHATSQQPQSRIQPIIQELPSNGQPASPIVHSLLLPNGPNHGADSNDSSKISTTPPSPYALPSNSISLIRRFNEIYQSLEVEKNAIHAHVNSRFAKIKQEFQEIHDFLNQFMVTSMKQQQQQQQQQNQQQNQQQQQRQQPQQQQHRSHDLHMDES
ncbi:hypothetical protein SAMD00019534_077390 [Acytostelium subglobosum LB1]|uniref:hypothetical protein n=1 Tax=Acytostelium subglobosum LB1 TaxID=1410327 RepID=UPI0006447AB7|nr:hypothetical protein SAMD00019534_077390 [Acytostelium subglobosum LB1]GAM24564.1 hypothetical protein SAMD00019534_077390 [Acytostelium subglobosum LB1]|eukprot:XP_012752233.1 hypothetical protein SAMD00019534_077390 [Acytostelium subglobosum LB1]